MSASMILATAYKRVLELTEQGKAEEARLLQKSLQDEFLALCEENDILKHQLTEVTDVLDLAGKIRYDGQKYWLLDDGRKGPFCQVCYDRDGLLVHLQEHEHHLECRNCRSLYMIPNTAAPKPEPTEIRTTLKKTIPLFLERELS